MELDALVQSAHALSPEDLHAMLKQNEPQLAELAKDPARLPAALAALDAFRHAIAWLYIADALGGVSEAQPATFLDVATRLLLSGDPQQLLMAPDKVVSVSRALQERAVASAQAVRAVQPLAAAVRVLQLSAHHLTPVHGDFLHCLHARTYNAALPLLKHDVLAVDTRPGQQPLTARDYLLYCYYGGMVCTGLRMHARAMELYLLAVTAPALALNAISVAAFKKYALLCLIARGAPAPLPKYTPGAVQRHCKLVAVEYDALGKAFTSDKSADELAAVITQHQEAFTRDGNMGLVRQCEAEWRKRRILRLTQCYLTLSLDAIAAAAKLGSAREAEHAVLRMIEAEEINASIDQAAGMVHFKEDPKQYNTVESAEELDAQMGTLRGLMGSLVALDDALVCSPAYLGRTMQNQPAARLGSGGGGALMSELE